MINKLKSFALFGSIHIAVPIILAKQLVGATWLQIGIAYAILYVGWWLVLGARFTTETLGWLVIMGMFWTIPAVPVLALGLQLLGIAG